MKNDERLVNILSLLNLKERYLSVEKCRSFNLDDIIDYSNIEIIRKGVINDSISFLEEYVFKGIVEN